MHAAFKIAIIALLFSGAATAQPSSSATCPSGQSSGRCSTGASGAAFSNYYYDSGGAWFGSEGTPSPTYANESSPSLKRNLPGYDTRPRTRQKQSSSFSTQDRSGHRSVTTRR